MVFSSFVRNWPWFLEVARALALLSHFNSVSGIELLGDWATACSSLFLACSLWRSPPVGPKEPWTLLSPYFPEVDSDASSCLLELADGSGRATPEARLISLDCLLPDLGCHPSLLS